MASGSALNHDGMLLLEAPLARVPHDELRSFLRTQQRFVERDLTFCSTSLQSLAKSARGTSAAAPPPPAASIGSSSRNAPVLSLPDLSGSSTPLVNESPADESTEQADISAVDASLMADVSFAESEVSGVANESITVLDSASASLANKTGSELERSLDLMIGRIKGLKRKLVSVHESTGATLNRLEARTTHLDDMHRIQTTASPAFDEWCRTRLDRMLVDWMLRKGFSDSAEMLARNRKIEKYVDLSLFAEIARIEASMGRETVKRHGTIVTAAEEIADGRSEGKARSCGPSLAWCSENKAALRKIRSSLEFDLRLQEFIEHTRQRTPESLHDAILYSRRYLLPYMVSTSGSSLTGDGGELGSGSKGAVKPDEKEEREEREQLEAIRSQVARSMGLLACGPERTAYEDLYSDDRWDILQRKFRAAALHIHSLPPQPLLNIALSAGLSSLKLPACYGDRPTGDAAPPAHLGGIAFGDERSNLLSVAGVTSTSISAPPSFPPAAGLSTGVQHAPPSVVVSPPLPGATISPSSLDHNHDHGSGATLTDSKNDNCPVCDSHGLGILAKEVPWSHHANSMLVCAISGRIMDENDPPMALPNGRVYSLTALQEMAANSPGGMSIVCPRTGTAFTINQIRKVYIS